LDETYQRILLGIKEENTGYGYVHRLLQCLTVSFRPLRVEELAEVLAIRFDEGESPDYYPDWRLEDAQEAVLSACSSLITIINVDDSPIVQFSHFSVKEFLISDRLANEKENLSRYHILPQPANKILAQASLSALLRLDDQVDKDNMKNFPLSMYAAQYWVEHGQFENVSSYIQELMVQLFDPSKRHFSTWVWIYDVDQPWDWVEHMSSKRPKQPEGVGLYYATICGFRGLVEHLIRSCPEDVNAWGGTHSTPLHASLTKGYFDIAELLLEHGADTSILDNVGLGPLHMASFRGRRDTVEFLLQHKTDVGVENGIDQTALDATGRNGELDVALGSLRYNVAVDSRDDRGSTALKIASRNGHLDIVQLLLENGAAVDAHDHEGWTPFGVASAFSHLDVVQFLLHNGAVVDSSSNDGMTPLESASQYGHLEIMQLLLQNGAAVDLSDNEGPTPLGLASAFGRLDIVQLLLQNGAAVDSCDHDGWTSCHLAS
jgi:ankyrin repeat protein